MKEKLLMWASVLLVIASLFLYSFASWMYFQNNKEVIAGGNSQNTEHTDDSEVIGEQESQEEGTQVEGSETIPPEETETTLPDETEKVELENQKIRLMMIGDNLMHMSVIRSGYRSDGSRNYDFMFEPIKDYLELADIKITNQETIFGGNDLGFSGYPQFNSPTELGDAIAKAGFNVVLHATNHTADKGINGMQHCLSFWDQYPEVMVAGMFKEADVENQDIGLLDINGVTFAILNYTYSPNLAALPESIQGHLGMLCNWDKETGLIDLKTIHPDVLTDIATAKEMADVVVVCPHWGNEYTFVPSYYQELFAKQMTEAGADLIIGTHPHVIQPVEWVVADNGNKALCYYSLGNYVSTQYDPESMLEAMAWVTFEVKDGAVEIVEAETGAFPMVYQYDTNHTFVSVYFLEDYTEELAQAHGIHLHNDGNHTLANLTKWAEDVLGEWIRSPKDPLKESIESAN